MITRVLLVLALLSCRASMARDLEPCAFRNSPVGMQIFIAGFGHPRGEADLDPALPIDNLRMQSDFGLIAWS